MRETAARERNILFLAAVVGEDDAPALATPENTTSGGLIWSAPTTTWDVSTLGPKSWWRAQYYYRARWYAPGMVSFAERDPEGYSDSPDLTQALGFNGFNFFDPNGHALYAFDGTWNTPADETNVWVLAQSYVGRSLYQKGVGTGGLLDQAVGGASGYGTHRKVKAAFLRFRQNWQKGDRTVDIIGFSRGAAAARVFAQKIFVNGRAAVGSSERPVIRFLGIFDTVYSMDFPGDAVNLGYSNFVPGNVLNVAHAVAGGERRGFFPLTSIKPSSGYSPWVRPGTYVEKEFPGAHSDIGGGYQDDRSAANRVLVWMWQQARSVGVPFREVPEKYQPKPDEMLMLHDSNRKDPATGEHELVMPEELDGRNRGRDARKVFRPGW